MAKKVRIQLNEIQRARLDTARGKVKSETPDSNRDNAHQEDSSDEFESKPMNPRRTRPTILIRVP
jgi:hypothetical protein